MGLPFGGYEMQSEVVINVLTIPRHEIETNPSSIDALMGTVDLLAENTVKEKTFTRNRH